MTDSAEAGGIHATEPSTALTIDPDAPASLKRKLTDLKLEIMTIDQYYDLTLIVGTPDHADGQKAFQISRSAMRHVSDIWTKMLAPGAWAESKQSKIEMPDDSCKAMLLILRIAHSQFAQLPNKLSMEDLQALATLTDKYNLVEIVRVMLELKKWLDPYKQEWKKIGASSAHLTEFAEMHQVFGNQDDYEYVVNRLAVEVEVDDEGFLIKGPEGNPSKLRSNLPERIFVQIKEIRRLILSEWVVCIDAAVNLALQGVADPENNRNPTCDKDLCSITRCGVLMRGLRATEYDIRFETAATLRKSVAFYWKGLKNIGSDSKPYAPCDKTMGYGRGAHYSSCSFEACFGDFGFLEKAKETLKKALHIDVWRQLQTAEYLQAVA